MRTHDHVTITFEFKPGDIVVMRPGDDRFRDTPTAYRVLARIAEDFGPGFLKHYQVRNCTNHSTFGEEGKIMTYQEAELMLRNTFDAAQKLTERDAKVPITGMAR